MKYAGPIQVARWNDLKPFWQTHYNRKEYYYNRDGKTANFYWSEKIFCFLPYCEFSDNFIGPIQYLTDRSTSFFFKVWNMIRLVLKLIKEIFSAETGVKRCIHGTSCLRLNSWNNGLVSNVCIRKTTPLFKYIHWWYFCCYRDCSKHFIFKERNPI